LINDLGDGRYRKVQQALVAQALPLYTLWTEIEKTYTSGDGCLDKLCMELVGCRRMQAQIQAIGRHRRFHRW
jgi:hypothetical protein